MAFSFSLPRAQTCSSVSLPRHASMRDRLSSSLRTEQSKKRRWRASSISASIRGRGVVVREPIHIIGGGLAGSEAAWQIARRGLRSRASRNAAGPADTRAPDGPAGRAGVQQFAQIRAGIHRARGCSRKSCAGSIRCCSKRRGRREYPAAMRSPWIAKSFPRKSPRPSRPSRWSSCGARKSPPSPRTPSLSSPPARSPAMRSPRKSPA